MRLIEPYALVDALSGLQWPKHLAPMNYLAALERIIVKKSNHLLECAPAA